MFGVRTHALNSSRNISVNWAIDPFWWNCVATTSTGKTTFRIRFFWEDSPHKHVTITGLFSTASTYLAFNKLSRYVTRQSQSVSARMVAVRRASKGFLHKALDLHRMPHKGMQIDDHADTPCLSSHDWVTCQMNLSILSWNKKYQCGFAMSYSHHKQLWTILRAYQGADSKDMWKNHTSNSIRCQQLSQSHFQRLFKPLDRPSF